MSELAHLDPESVDAIARRLLELLRSEGAIGTAPPALAGELLSAAEVARRFGVDRSWVYAHADELGAVRLGSGVKPRLRFDPERVHDALDARSASERARKGEVPAATRVRDLDLNGLVPNGLDSLPERWRDAAGASSRESAR